MCVHIEHLNLDYIYTGDALDVLRTLPSKSINCGITSPPYYQLRDYGVEKQLGLEVCPDDYVRRLVDVFMEFHRVLQDDGTLWVVIGDSYNNKKNLIGAPWRLAFAMRDAGWYLRQEVIWAKPNPMPESVTDRCTKSHESVFLFSKKEKYYFDHLAIQEQAAYDGRKDTRMKGSHKYSQGVTGLYPQTFAARGHERWNMRDGVYLRNKRDVWTVPTKPLRENHFAPFPANLIAPCVLSGTQEGGVVMDMFIGSGTTAIVAKKLGRRYVGIELNPDYVLLANRRIERETRSLFN
jgi:DNA modification methylase